MDPCSDTSTDLPVIPFCEDPLVEFKASLYDLLDPDERGQKTCRPFVDGLSAVETAGLEVDPTLLEVDTAKLPEDGVKRSEVFDLAADRNVKVATVCVAAMAWGEMHLRHWNTLCRTSGGKWLEVAQCIRDGKLTRAQAYERLKALRAQGKLKGMGPAYFTKVIYFLAPRCQPERRSGYIMDQWAGSSVNLLTGSEMVLFDVTRTWKISRGRLEPSFEFFVSDENTSDDYEAFCSVMDRLACRFCLCVDQVDQALFSVGRPKPGTWREYVRAHRPGLLSATLDQGR